MKMKIQNEVDPSTLGLPHISISAMHVKGMSDKRQNRPILFADRIANKNLSCVMQKLPDFVGQQNRLILSAKIEHVLSSTILSGDFSYIGQQILFMLPW